LAEAFVGVVASCSYQQYNLGNYRSTTYNVDDGVACRLTNKGKFCLNFAYSFLAHSLNHPMFNLFNVIWKWLGPQRLCTFLCKVPKGALIMNEVCLTMVYLSPPSVLFVAFTHNR